MKTLALSIILAVCMLQGVAQKQLRLSLPPVNLPAASQIYADTFAVYWHVDSEVKQVGTPSIQMYYTNIFGDNPPEAEFVQDSIYAMLFLPEYKKESAVLLHWTVRINENPIFEPGVDNEKVLTVQKIDPEIETLRLLVQSAYRWQNLQMLANAYEKRACFVNAYYLYLRMMELDYPTDKELFEKYFERNKEKFQPEVRALHHGAQR